MYITPWAGGQIQTPLYPTSKLYFDGVAFGHEMSLDEIAPLPDFYYARLVRPQQIFLGSMRGAAIYADCADCGAEDAVIHVCLKDKQGGTAVIPLDGGVTFPQRGACP